MLEDHRGRRETIASRHAVGDPQHQSVLKDLHLQMALVELDSPCLILELNRCISAMVIAPIRISWLMALFILNEKLSSA